MKNIHPKRLGPYACPKKECEKWLDSGKYLVSTAAALISSLYFFYFFFLF